MSTDYTRPNGFARWGWLCAALNAVLVFLNLAALVFLDGGVWNWGAIAVCTASGIFCFRTWRSAVRSDAKHRAWMRKFDATFGTLR